MKWYKTSITPCWSGYKDLLYIHEEFNDPVSVQRWRDLGYTQDTFTGSLYDMRFDQPPWMPTVLENFTDWKNVGWCMYEMSPGLILPNHSDLYVKYREVYGVTDPTTIWRALVMIEDWQSGHYLEVDNTPVGQWKAGDTFVWNYDTLHLAANMGTTKRYTLQITGIVNK